jgi:endogenous inhibitor of DNA gyrase (YacG/DUF329 family)
MPPRPDRPAGKDDRAARKVRACPICGRPADEARRPFCSGRCRDLDLHRWLSGSYVVPGSENDEEDEK